MTLGKSTLNTVVINLNGLTPVQILPYNERRLSLLFAPASGSNTHVWFNASQLTGPDGINLQNNASFTLNFDQHDALVWGPWFAVDLLGASHILVAETLASDAIVDLENNAKSVDIAERVVNRALEISRARETNVSKHRTLFVDEHRMDPNTRT